MGILRGTSGSPFRGLHSRSLGEAGITAGLRLGHAGVFEEL